MERLFDFTSDYTLENQRVCLRPLQTSDDQHLLEFSLNEPETWQFSLIGAIGSEGLKQYIGLALGGRTERREYPFIVFDKATQQYAGSTRFYDIQLQQKCLQLGYTWYGKRYRGTGLNAHCKYLLLEFAFGFMEMERVEFRADTDNTRSIAAMKSIGCTEEGILRSNGYRQDGSRRDSIVLSILRQEWQKTVREQLNAKLQAADQA